MTRSISKPFVSASAAGARLILCDMEIADTPEGDLQFGIMGQFAQYERQLIRKRTMAGRRHRAEQGYQPCRSQSPLGYHIVTKGEALAGLYGGTAARRPALTSCWRMKP